jgi:heme/copper-type cytochrome/quinol oxidase subunit 2
VLNRDIAANAALAFACPMVSAACAVGANQSSALTRSAIAATVVAAFVFVTALFVLIIYRTSGDCL